MRYYIYISDSKVDMLLPQIPSEAKRKIATEFKIDLKVLSALRKSETETTDNRFSRLEAVCAFIQDYGNVGSVAEPDDYVYGSMPLRMLTDRNFVYFGGSDQGTNTVVGLSGSVKHLIGISPPTNAHGSSSLLSFTATFLRTIIDSIESSLEVSKVHLRDTLNDAVRVTRSMGGPEQHFEFLAKRLLYEKILVKHLAYQKNVVVRFSDDGKPIYDEVDGKPAEAATEHKAQERTETYVLLATPIYVALSDRPRFLNV